MGLAVIYGIFFIFTLNGGIFCIILLVPLNTVIIMNNVLFIRSFCPLKISGL